jgi:alcohol dehydrogenase class IV
VHGFAGPLGGLYPAPHGAVCARLLPSVMRVNVAALRARHPDAPALGRYSEVARILTGESTAVVEDGVEWVRDLCVELDVPPLATYGIREEDFPVICDKACKASSMRGNPIELTDDELTDILEQAL